MNKRVIEHTVMLVITIGLTYLWLNIEFLSRYSLQAFSFAILVFFIIKRSKRAKIWHVLPDPLSTETVVVTFSFLLLIGATGNINSQFFPLGYVHLFFLTLVCHESTTIVATLAIMFFHLLLTPVVGMPELSTILALPIVTTFFIFAKRQYDEVQLDRSIITAEEKEIEELTEEEQEMENFLRKFVYPELYEMWQKLSNKKISPQEMKTHLALVLSEIQKKVKG